MATTYDVYADLRLRTHGAGRALGALSSRLAAMQGRLRGTQTAAGGLFRTIASLGLGYVGFQAITGAVTSATASVIGYSTAIENGIITVTALSNQVEGIPWAQAEARAGGFVETLNELSLASTATGEQFLSIFSQISGPIGAITGDLESAIQPTADLAAAASVLGVDFEQAARDTSMMLRGLAGTDVAMFSMLKSIGAITESTEQWNALAKRDPAEALRRYTEALGTFREAATAQGRSWAGVTSSFKGIVQVFAGVLAGPIFESIKRFLADLNTRMLANKDVIKATLTGVGSAIASKLDRVFEMANAALRYVTENWGTISERIGAAASKFRELAPVMGKMTLALGALSAVKTVLAPLLGVASMLASAGSGIAALFGGGAAAGAAGTAAAATTAAATAPAAAGLGTGFAAMGAEAMGGVLGGGGGALGALATALAPLALILSAIVGVVVIAVEKWDALVAAFAPMFDLIGPIGEDLMGLGEAIWDIIRPITKLVGGGLLITMGVYFIAIVSVLRVVVAALRWAFEGIASLFGYVEPYVDEFIDFIIAAFGKLAEWARGLVGWLVDARNRFHGVEEAAEGRGRVQTLEETDIVGDPSGAPVSGDRPTTVVHNDMRGSRISIKQEFRQADPDRILVRTMEELNRAAEQRIGSGFAPALTR